MARKDNLLEVNSKLYPIPNCHMCNRQYSSDQVISLFCDHVLCQPCFKHICINRTVMCSLCHKFTRFIVDASNQLIPHEYILPSTTLMKETEQPSVLKSTDQLPPERIIVELSKDKKLIYADMQAGNPFFTKKAVVDATRDIQSIATVKASNFSVSPVAHVVESNSEVHQGARGKNAETAQQNSNSREKSVKAIIPKLKGRLPAKGATFRGTVSAAYGVSLIYVQIDDYERSQFRVLHQELQVELGKQCQTQDSVIRNPRKAYICAVYHDREWYRGLIEGVVDDNVQVLLIDTGHRLNVSKSGIHWLTKCLQKLPAQAVRCGLYGVSSLRTDQLRPCGVATILQSIINKPVTLTVAKYLPGSVGELRCQEARLLVDMHVDGDALSINEQIWELGKVAFVVPSPSTGYSSGSQSPLSEGTVQHTASLLNHMRVGGGAPSVNEQSRGLGKAAPSGSSTEYSLGSRSEGPVPRTVGSLSNQRSWVKMDATALPTQFEGKVTWVDDHGGIYLHEAAWTKQLVCIREGLNGALRSSKHTKTNFQPGDACIAKYENNWYRATVLSIGINKVSVFFIDYGASEELDISAIWDQNLFAEVPVKTFRCELHNIRLAAVSSGGLKKATELLRELAAGARFLVTVESTVPLRVSLKFFDSDDLGAILTNLRIAEYIKRDKRSKSRRSMKRC